MSGIGAAAVPPTGAGAGMPPMGIGAAAVPPTGAGAGMPPMGAVPPMGAGVGMPPIGAAGGVGPGMFWPADDSLSFCVCANLHLLLQLLAAQQIPLTWMMIMVYKF
jgi:hypothetical protein